MKKVFNCLRTEVQEQQVDSTFFDMLFWTLTFIISLQALLGSLNLPKSVVEGSWLICIVVLTGLSGYFTYVHFKVTRPRKALDRIEYLIIATIAFGFFARFYNTDSLSFWFDEYHQLKLLRNEEQRPLLKWILLELQLPLYYMLTKSQMVLFGESSLSLRFWSLLGGSLLPLACWLGLHKLKFNKLIILLAVSYFALHPFLIFKSLVVRPYSLYSLFIGIFWIYFLLSLKDERYQFRVAISLFLCFLTLSFLTTVLVFAMLVAIVVVDMSYKGLFKQILKHKGVCWGFLAALPLNLYLTFLNLEMHWQGQLIFLDTINKSLLFNSVPQIDFYNIGLLTINLSSFRVQYFLCFLLVSMGFISIFFLKRSKIQTQIDLNGLAITSIVTALYPLIFVPVFSSVATYSHHQIRFAMAGVILFGLLLAQVLQSSLQFFAVFKIENYLKMAERITLILFILTLLVLSPRFYSFIFVSPTPFNRPHWKGFYELVKESHHSVIRHLPGTFHSFLPPLVGKTYYASQSKHYFADRRLSYANLPDLGEDISRLASPHPFYPHYYYVMISPYWSAREFSFPDVNQFQFNEENGFKVYDVYDQLYMHVIAFKNDEMLSKRLYDYFEYVYEHSQAYLQKKSMLFFLLFYAYHFNDIDRFEVYSQWWEKEKFEPRWIEFKPSESF
jgi:hypothetical protein